jgi:NADH pyrophosphatase NudC (nudix superfamily)
LPFASTVAQSSSDQQNKKTVLGAPAPKLAELTKQPPAAAAAPAAQFCGRCGKPMQYVAQYQRWYCQGCQQYA